MQKIIIVDNFYDQPWAMQGKAKSLEYTKGSHFHRTQPYLTDEAYMKLSKLVGDIKLDHHWVNPQPDSNFNGSFYTWLGHTEKPDHIHHDHQDYVGVVFLSENLTSNNGLSFWRHKRSERSAALNLSNVDELCKFGKQKYYWEEIDRIGYNFNRLVLYGGKRFHSAHINSKNRINQLFCFNTNV